MTSSIAHATHPQRGKARGTGAKANFMLPDSSSESLSIDNSMNMKSQGSIKTFMTLPPGAVVMPINFGVKYKPAKLGLEYKLQDLPVDQICIYEVTLTSYIE